MLRCAGCLTIALLLAGSGCARNTKINQALALQPREHDGQIPLAQVVQPDRPELAEHTPATPAGGVDHQTFVAALAEVERIGRHDPAAQARLLDDLRHTQSELIPQLLAARRNLGNRYGAPEAGPIENAQPPDVQLASHQPRLEGIEVAPPQRESPPGVQTADWNAPPPRPATLDELIRERERSLVREPATPDELREHLELRLLYLTAGRNEESLQPIPGVDADGQKLWRGTLEGMALYLVATQGPIPAGWTKTVSHKLEQVAEELSRQVPIEIRRLAFCTRIASYGVFDPFPANRFRPKSEVLLYVELDHFISRHTAAGFRTELASRYKLVDTAGRVVHERGFAKTVDLCRNRRRDYFLALRFAWPELPPGTYTLRLEVRDLHSGHTGRSSIEFELVSQ